MSIKEDASSNTLPIIQVGEETVKTSSWEDDKSSKVSELKLMEDFSTVSL